jgi:hypothetical protein
MRNTSGKSVDLRRQSGLLLTFGVVAIMVGCTLLAIRTGPSAADHPLTIALRCNAHHNRLRSRDFLDPQKVGSSVDRIITGALKLALSL